MVILKTTLVLIKKAKRTQFLFALILILHDTFSQTSTNLVPNNSFEEFIACPNGVGQLSNCNFWFRGTFNSSVDFFNNCATTTIVSVPQNGAGEQFAQHGNNYVGFGVFCQSVECREYAEIGLKQTLQKNKNYCVNFYVSLAEYSKYAIANIGAYFTKDSLKNFYPIVPPLNLFLNPHIESFSLTPIFDTINWIKIQGSYLANGDENFITIGNFRNNVNTNVQQIKPLNPAEAYNISYYYLDNISVVEIKPAKAASHDTILVCPNTTFTLGTDSAWDATYSWQPPIGLSCTNCPNPVITATNNIKYYLSKEQCSSITKDSVVIKIYNDAVSIFPINNHTICAGNTTTLSTDSNSFFSYNWQPTVGLNCNNCALPLASPSVATTYTLTKGACGISNTANFNVSIKPNFTFTPQITLTNSVNCLFDTLNFLIINPPNCNDLNYEWQPQSTFVLSFTNTASALIQNNSYYYVSINNSNNGIYCPFVKKDSIYISLPDTCTKPLVIPSIFTPNYDNVNDVWEFTIPYGAKLNAVYVYNRWGALIYTINESVLHSNISKIKTVYWDGHTASGEQCADGIYFYIVEFEVNGNKKTLKGNVTLIR